MTCMERTTQSGQVFVVARCGPRGKGPCRVRLAMQVNEQGLAPVIYVNGSGWLPPKEAAGYMVWCLKHHYPMRGNVIRATYSEGPCGPDCREAEGLICKCVCGGAHHGTEAK